MQANFNLLVQTATYQDMQLKLVDGKPILFENNGTISIDAVLDMNFNLPQ